mgnify:CR=1 FL=1
MSKAVLISIRPKWCELIANGKKTIEVRKSRPNLRPPFKCYIYCTQPKYPHEDYIATDYPKPQFYGGGKVIGEFVCDSIDTYDDDTIFSFLHEDYARWNDFDLDRACIHPEDFQNYSGGKWLYGWHISGLKIYDKPKKLTEFHTWKKCKSCSKSGYESTACIYDKNCMVPAEITKAPQSWCYVEELSDG